MPSKKRKYNARFPAGRIKKIMQTDEDVGKVAQAVPVIISRTLELFVESLLTKAMEITNAKNAKTLSPSHMKQCILSESRFDFLKDLVKNIPDINNEEQEFQPLLSTSTSQQNNLEMEPATVAPSVRINLGDVQKENKTNENITANFYTEQSTSAPESSSTVIQYSTKSPETSPSTVNLSGPPVFHIEFKANDSRHIKVPPLIPLLQQPPQNDIYNNYSSNNDSLCIDEDYDN